MSRSSKINPVLPDPPERYHHGDLRRALLSAAHTLATEVGVDSFSLREVARRAGVSVGAPYHHFRDKSALIRALAIEAFEQLAIELNASQARAADAQLAELALAYVMFAWHHPVEFRFMFRGDLCRVEADGIDPLEVASLQAFDVLKQKVTKAIQQGLMAEAEVESISLTIWSTVHGLATLVLDSPMGKTLDAQAVEAMAKSVWQQLYQGLKSAEGSRSKI